MLRPALFFSLVPALLCAQTEETTPVFRSEVALVRVDVQVLDRNARPVMDLLREDFVLRDEGKVQPILNFASEQMPIDILFLLDVSGSMRPHVERIAQASRQALYVLGQDDRIGIMVFDRQTRVRMQFRNVGDTIYREFDNVLNRESFNGGTDITRGMMDAADYVRKNARRDARHAIVILTDDQTEFERDDERVEQALLRADAVMSALLAPDAIGRRSGGYPGPQGGGIPGGRTGRRGGWGDLGTIILGGGGGYPGGGGGGYPRGGGGGGVSNGRMRSAGTAEIARASGGDGYQVDDASALKTTLSRLRQRYALYFNLPPGARQGQERRISIALTGSATQRNSGAELRHRPTYLSPADSNGDPNITVISDAKPEPATNNEDRPVYRRRPVGDGTGGGRGPNPQVGSTDKPLPPVEQSSPERPTGGWRKAEVGDKPAPVEPSPKEVASAPASPAPSPTKKGGWRKATDPEPPAPPKQ